MHHTSRDPRAQNLRFVAPIPEQIEIPTVQTQGGIPWPLCLLYYMYSDSLENLEFKPKLICFCFFSSWNSDTSSKQISSAKR